MKVVKEREKSNTINILFTDKALRFINKKRLNNPIILVNLVYKSGGGGCSGGPSTPVPHTNVMMVDGGDPGEGFERVETKDRIPLYMAKPLFEVAKHAGNPLIVNARGVWIRKRLNLEGLDLTPLCKMEGGPHRETSCH